MAAVLDDLALIARDVETRGWGCRDDFVDADTARALCAHAARLYSQGEFKPAAVGTGSQRSVRPEVRGDEILWIDDTRQAPLSEACARFEALRLTLNRELALGLFEHEIHYARFAPGAFYARHVDRFSGDASRVLSTALYLNDGWRGEHGGQLRLHLGGASGPQTHDVLPRAGRLVVFLSHEICHEVLPARRERFSLTGWFRTRSAGP